MKDLKIDLDSQDLVLENGNLAFVEDYDELRQRVFIRSLTHKGEWLFDTNIGIDYLGEVMLRNPDVELIQSRFVNEYASVDGVNGVTYFNLIIEDTTRTATIEIALDTIYGSIPLTLTP